MNVQGNTDYPGQVTQCTVKQLKSEAMMVVYAVIIEENEEEGPSSIHRMQVPGSFLQAVLRILLVPGISLQHGLTPRDLRILAISPLDPVGDCLDEALSAQR